MKEKIQFLKRHYFPEVVALLVIFGAVGAFASLYASQRSSMPIPYQGKLLDSNSIPVADGTHYMEFAIYDSATGGSCLWSTGDGAGAANCTSSSSIAVTVSRGVFTALLGNGGSKNPEILSTITGNFDSGTYYLGITACGTGDSCESQMTPRRQLGGVPYAYNAGYLGGAASSSFAVLAGIAGGQTLIGGTATNETLTLQGNSASANTPPNSAIIFKVGNSGGTTAATILNSGFVGIGTTTPPALLTLTGGTATGTPSIAGTFLSLTVSSTFRDTVTANTETSPDISFVGLGRGVFDSTFSVTTTNAYMLYVAGSPQRCITGVAGCTAPSDMNILNSIALGIGAGTISGNTQNSYGLYVNAQTGATNNYAATFASGNVGIGTTTPGYLLTLATESGGSSLLRIENPSSASAAYTGISISNEHVSGDASALILNTYGTGFSTSTSHFPDTGLIESGSNLSNGLVLSAQTGPIRFWSVGGASTDMMRIGPAGTYYVGIGTSTAQSLLTLDSGFNGITANLQIGQRIFFGAESGGAGWLGFNSRVHDSGTGIAGVASAFGGPAGIYLAGGSTGIDFVTLSGWPGGPAAFYDVSSDRVDVTMTLNGDGDLGLGTTTPGIANDAPGSTSTILTIGSRESSIRGVLTLTGYTSGVVSIQAANSTTDWQFTLPANDGNSGQYLKTDGSGNTSWDNPSAGSGAMTFVSEQNGTSTINDTSLSSTTLATATLPMLENNDSLLIYYNILHTGGGGGLTYRVTVADSPDKPIACLGGSADMSCSNITGDSPSMGSILLRKHVTGPHIWALANAAGGIVTQNMVSSTWNNASWTAGNANINLIISSSTNANTGTSTWRFTIYKLTGS